MMHFKWIALFCFLSFFFYSTIAQETHDNYAVFDWGFSFFKSNPTDIDHIRGGVASFYAENSNKGLACFSFRGTTSVKFETLRLNGRIGMATGLRFSEYVQDYGKWDLITEGSNYFYYLYKQDDQNTYYAQLKSILQTSAYLGVPFEFSFFPLENAHYAKFYVKMGTEFNFRVSTNTSINFSDNFSEVLENEVAQQVSNPSVIGLSIYNCLGFQAGKSGKPTFSVELLIPLFTMNPGSAGLVTNGFGGGIQFNYHVPIKSGNQ
jgi:hypothetical protein